MPGNTINILLVNDLPIMRRGLHMIIEGQADMLVIGEVASAVEAIEVLESLSPDLVLLSLMAPDCKELQIIYDHIEKNSLESKVIVLTIHKDRQFVQKVFASGAHGCLLQYAEEAEVISTIRAVTQGNMVIDPSITGDILALIIKTSSKRKRWGGSLSKRQNDILVMVAQGFSDKQISEKMHISIKTVESHKSRIKEKLKITLRSELVQYALEHKMIDFNYSDK